MAYDNKNYKLTEAKGNLDPDSISNGEIIAITDGIVKDFVKNTTNWKNPDENCIEVEIDCGKDLTFKQLYTYRQDDTGMLVNKNSNLGLFIAKYGKLPSIGIKVKVIADSKGFGHIKVD